MHIGSQLTTLDPYRDAIAKVRELIVQLRADGHRIDRFDIGGGLGIVYADEQPPSIADFLQLVAKETDGLGCELTFEPGRRLVGEAGVLVSEVILVKPGVSKTFVIVDAAMNDLIRPTLYEAWHDIVPVRRPRPDAATIRCDIVGPICESGDYLAQNRDLAPAFCRRPHHGTLGGCVRGGDGLELQHAGRWRPRSWSMARDLRSSVPGPRSTRCSLRSGSRPGWSQRKRKSERTRWTPPKPPRSLLPASSARSAWRGWRWPGKACGRG